MIWKVAVDSMFHDKHNKFRYDYFDAFYKASVEQADIMSNDLVLDYGCQHQKLGKYVREKKANYIGFDIDKRFTDIKDRESVDPNVIITTHVLEHLDDKQLDDFIRYVKRKKPRALIVTLPLENIISTILGLIDGIYFSNRIEHFTKWNRVCNKLSKHFTNTRIETVWFMSIVTRWDVRT